MIERISTLAPRSRYNVLTQHNLKVVELQSEVDQLRKDKVVMKSEITTLQHMINELINDHIA